MSWEEARRENVWLRAMLMGPTGAGKTKAALEIATKLFDGSLPVLLADSEHKRSKLYADQYAFRRRDIHDDCSPEAYIRIVDDAEREYPGSVLIIDSISHEWVGPKGVLSEADRFGDWKTIRPRHNAFVERILDSQLHVIACCRSKMKYEVGEEEYQGRTRQVIRKLGLGPIQDDTIPYEFDVVGALDPVSHECTFSNRCEPLVDTTRSLVPGDEVAEILTRWLSEGDPPPPPPVADPEAVEELRSLLLLEGHSAEFIEERFEAARQQNRGELHPDYVEQRLAKARARVEGVAAE